MDIKKLCTTVIGVAGAVSIFVTILLGVPQIIALYWKELPVWMDSPTFWWAVGLSSVTIFFIVLVWLPWGQRPRHQRYPTYLPPEDQYVTDYRDRLFEHTQWLGKKRQYKQFAKVVNNELEIVLPVMLQANFGKKERNQFVLAVSEARKLSNDSAILFKVAMGQLDAMLIARRNRLCAEYQSRQSSDAPAKFTAP
ncbi:MAG: hypothetical protein NTY19_42560 [Planctomycetota bacterium]|nr:hypothetical protein [Planctomycetota bacterium]